MEQVLTGNNITVGTQYRTYCNITLIVSLSFFCTQIVVKEGSYAVKKQLSVATNVPLTVFSCFIKNTVTEYVGFLYHLVHSW